MSTTPNAAARIQAQTRQMQGKDVICANCGSQHFYELQVTRYLAGGSGSVEILADPNEQVHPLLMCPCGTPVLPKPAVGRRHGGVFETSHKLFRESVEKAQEYLKTTNPQVINDGVLQLSAGKYIEAQVESLMGRLSKLEQELGTSSKESTSKGSKNATPKTDTTKDVVNDH